MDFPTDLRYTRTHQWVRLENGIAVTGITAFAAQELGSVRSLRLPQPGSVIGRTLLLGSVLGANGPQPLEMPLSGTFQSGNPAAEQTLDLIRRDPYGNGWIARIRASEPGQLDDLLSADQYRQFIGQ